MVLRVFFIILCRRQRFTKAILRIKLFHIYKYLALEIEGDIMMKYNTCLLGVPIFKNLSEDDLVAITDLIQPIDLEKNEDLFQSGDTISDLYILHKGSLKVYDITADGRTQILRVLRPGEFLGENSLFNGSVSKEFVGAMRNSHVCRISGEAFKQLLLDSPKLSMQIIEVLAHRLGEIENKILLNSTLPTQQRVLRTLEQLADESGLVLLQTSKKDFASSLGMAQETLSRQLAILQKENIISMSGQRMIQLL